MKKNLKLYIAAAVAFLILFLLYQRNRITKQVATLAQWINSSTEAKDWKATIQSKAASAGIPYEQQLQLDALYAIKNNPKYSAFAWLV